MQYHIDIKHASHTNFPAIHYHDYTYIYIDGRIKHTIINQILSSINLKHSLQNTINYGQNSTHDTPHEVQLEYRHDVVPNSSPSSKNYASANVEKQRALTCRGRLRRWPGPRWPRRCRYTAADEARVSLFPTGLTIPSRHPVYSAGYPVSQRYYPAGYPVSQHDYHYLITSPIIHPNKSYYR